MLEATMHKFLRNSYLNQQSNYYKKIKKFQVFRHLKNNMHSEMKLITNVAGFKLLSRQLQRHRRITSIYFILDDTSLKPKLFVHKCHL